MSRLTGKDAKNLREAYAAVYAPQITEEQVWEEVEEWVNSLIEEGYDLSEYSWEEMYEAYIEEQQKNPPPGDVGYRLGRGLVGALRDLPSATMAQLQGKENEALKRQGQRGEKLRSLITTGKIEDKPAVTKPQPQKPLVDPKTGRNVFDGTTPAGSAARPPAAGRGAAGSTARPSGGAGGAAGSASRPSGGAGGAAGSAAKPSGGAAASPTKPAPAGQTGDKAKDMDTWAKANPKLAAAAAERQRIRGTQQTDNPLMKDFRSRLPMNSPSVQSPDVANLGAGNQSLTQNPNALKAATPAATPKPTPAATTSTPAEPKSTPRVVQTSTPASVANPFKSPGSLSAATSAVKSATSAKPPEKRQTQLFHTDLYDLVKGHLLDEGYADSEESALAIMANMSEEWRESIVEAEVLAQKGGVPGTVQVQKKIEGGILGFGGQTVSNPVPGTFKAKDVSSSDAARYNVGVDRKFGGAAPGKEPTKSALSTQKTAQRSGHSGYMQVRDPGSLPDTGLPGRESRGRASDQNFAIGRPRNY